MRKPQSNASPWTQEARARSPEQWYQMVSRVRGRETRIKVACLVWWDWFGNRRATDAWPHLNQWIAAYWVGMEADPTKVAAALISMGYPARQAWDRANGWKNTKKSQ